MVKPHRRLGFIGPRELHDVAPFKTGANATLPSRVALPKPDASSQTEYIEKWFRRAQSSGVLVQDPSGLPSWAHGVSSNPHWPEWVTFRHLYYDALAASDRYFGPYSFATTCHRLMPGLRKTDINRKITNRHGVVLSFRSYVVWYTLPYDVS